MVYSYIFYHTRRLFNVSNTQGVINSRVSKKKVIASVVKQSLGARVDKTQ